MKICIPTKGRAGKVLTLNIIAHEDAILYVEAQEYHAYHEAYPDVEIRVLPLSNQGIGYARNYIINNQSGYIGMWDDDLIEFLDANQDGKQVSTDNVIRLMQLELEDGAMVVGTQTIAKDVPNEDYIQDIGYVIYGINADECKQINFDASWKCCEDTEWHFRVLLAGKKEIAFTDIWYHTAPRRSPGGCFDSVYGVSDFEAQALEKLRIMYADYVEEHTGFDGFYRYMYEKFPNCHFKRVLHV